ncbi:GNAT family N-acetyltransferase [bacterium]|nr:MAG: GNAT family N-acetyltransferase [bacterium]
MIIKAKLAHLPQILELNSQIIDYMTSLGFSHWSERYPTEAIFRKDIMTGSQYVYIIDEKVRGIVSYDIKHHEYFDTIQWLNNNQTSYFVHRLAVDPEFQGQGIANELMEFTEYNARRDGMSSIKLGAFKGYEKVVNFYKKRGYVICGEILFDVSTTTFYGMEKLLID